LIPSWEAYNRAEQDRDPLQIRWAQNETGEWIKVVWGNQSRPPANGGPLPVAQSMNRQDTGEWIWVWLGYNVPLDWQRGPQRMEQFVAPGKEGEQLVCLRPCGSPAHQDAPPALQAGDEHGSSDWQSPDDLAALGAVGTNPSTNRRVIYCPADGQAVRVPADRGKIRVACPCGHKWEWSPS
jgi:hypothetical protein